MREPLLFIADGLPKLDEEIRKVFPRADFQPWTIQASRNFESEVRDTDKELIERQLKKVFLSETMEEELLRVNEFKILWNKRYLDRYTTLSMR